MGFYGNIANAAKTSMQFDRKYCNRFEMETKCSTDGVMAGRYILVEYDLSWNNDGSTNDAFTIIYTRTVNGVEEFSPAYDFSIPLFPWIDVIYRAVEIQQISPLLSSYTNKYYIGVLNNELQYDSIIKKQNEIREELVNIENKYQSHLITEQEYKLLKEQSYAKYHSALTDAGGSYLKLASNSDSNYVNNFNIDKEYYGDSRGWDSTVWTKTYDSEGNPKYVMIAELNSVVPTFNISIDAPTDLPQAPHFDEADTNIFYTLHLQPNWGFRVADIDFNVEAFDPQINKTDKILKHDEVNTDNEITLEPTGSSGFEYNDHDNPGHKKTSKDIQELRIHLPAIGNMMSDAWDLIHGPRRNNDMRQIDPETKEYIGSLQGRLDSIDKMETNEIPIKRASDGQLVGTKINGNTQRVVNDILSEELSKSFTSDDAWIRTEINENIIDDNGNNGISIHHTFTKKSDTEEAINLNTSNENIIELYTPHVDAAGHVVGKNIKKITLPYGYSKIKGDTGNTEATTVYNELTFGSDEWLTATVDKDKVTYKHNYPGYKDNTASSFNINGNGDTIVIETLNRDATGHITHINKNTVTLPFGYKTFNGDTGSSSADNTQDAMSINGDNWINVAVSNDKIALTHKDPTGTKSSNENIVLNFGDNFIIDDHYFDDKGHCFGTNTHTVKIPSLSLSEENSGNIVVGLSLDKTDNGKIIASKSNIGSLKLTGYTSLSHQGDFDIKATDTLNTALSKLNYNIAINSDALDTINKNLKSAAYTESTAYATSAQGAKADSALQPNSTFVYDSENDVQKTLPELYEIVFNLQKELEILKGEKSDSDN